MKTTKQEMQRALNALRLEVDGSIVDDIQKRFDDYCAESTKKDVFVIECELDNNGNSFIGGVFSSIENANAALPLLSQHLRHNIITFEIDVI